MRDQVFVKASVTALFIPSKHPPPKNIRRYSFLHPHNYTMNHKHIEVVVKAILWRYSCIGRRSTESYLSTVLLEYK